MNVKVSVPCWQCEECKFPGTELPNKRTWYSPVMQLPSDKLISQTPAVSVNNFVVHNLTYHSMPPISGSHVAARVLSCSWMWCVFPIYVLIMRQCFKGFKLTMWSLSIYMTSSNHVLIDYMCWHQQMVRFLWCAQPLLTISMPMLRIAMVFLLYLEVILMVMTYSTLHTLLHSMIFLSTGNHDKVSVLCFQCVEYLIPRFN